MENLTRTLTNIMEMRVLAALILILICAVIMPLKEARYSIWGQTATATLLSVNPERRGRDSSERWKRVAYQFDDDGLTRSESDLVTTNWPVPGFDKTGIAPANTTIQIEYLPGGSSSRLKGHDNKAWYWISAIVAVLATIVAACWWTFRDASTHRRIDAGR